MNWTHKTSELITTTAATMITSKIVIQFERQLNDIQNFCNLLCVISFHFVVFSSASSSSLLLNKLFNSFVEPIVSKHKHTNAKKKQRAAAAFAFTFAICHNSQQYLICIFSGQFCRTEHTYVFVEWTDIDREGKAHNLHTTTTKKPVLRDVHIYLHREKETVFKRHGNAHSHFRFCGDVSLISYC